MSHVLITGAGGFIGRHLVAALIERGDQVRVLLHQPSHNQTLPDTVELYYGDITDSALIRSALAGIDVVYHLAAQVSNGYSIAHPAETFAVNVGGTLNVLEAAGKNTRIVIVSTADVYGAPLYSPLDERHPLQARTPYAASKIAAEALALSFFYSRNIPVSVARLFNVYGPGQNEGALVPTIINQALTRSTVELGALTPIRDWLYVGDAVAGLIAAATHEAAIGETIHFGTGEALSVGDLAQQILTLLGSSAYIESREDRLRASEAATLRLCADISKASSLLGWQPIIPLDQGLRLTIDCVHASHRAQNKR